jgi:hypothetical protein
MGVIDTAPATSMRRGQGPVEVICQHCDRPETLHAGEYLRSMVVNRKTYCHEVIRNGGVIVRKAGHL